MEAKTKTRNRKAGPRRPAVVEDAPAGGVGLSTLNPQPSTVAPLRGRPPHLALVDDNPAVHAAVREHLQQAGEPWQVSGYHNGAAALKAVAAAPQVVLMEQTLPDGCGLEWTGRLKSRHPDLPVVIHTTKGSPEKLLKALSIEAMGYVVTADGQTAWAKHLRKAMEGRFTMCEQAERLLAKACSSLGRSNPWGLTHKEQEAMLWLSRNKSEKEISTLMHVPIGTTHAQLMSAYKKLGAHSRAEAIAKYLSNVRGGGKMGIRADASMKSRLYHFLYQ